MRKISITLMALLCVTAFSACGNSTESEVPVESTSTVVEESSTVEDAPEEATEESTIYIGAYGEFAEYTVELPVVDFSDSDATNAYLEALIGEISARTNWELNCTVTAYKSVGVSFPEDSSLFVGPPEPQVDEFFVYDGYQLVTTILDSVKKTVQMNLVGEGGDPDAVEVYFSTTEDTQLEFPDLGMYVPLEEPYVEIVQIEE